ncbi:hypothetical protein CAPTEDRAFT_194799 [Capitella teleta]|uniref:Uncharacterized protein n=1 Tax=Capitella teleta TaxID=283909 RepID=R7US72_CAPTE|nr:hypothetical protein CAPTEDRAFT_194799 [Capitella teleta]|eukprot:ELU09364.1 hypothetical protein CAPTEDRAFT_194799 [Capitella teleta]
MASDVKRASEVKRMVMGLSACEMELRLIQLYNAWLWVQLSMHMNPCRCRLLGYANHFEISETELAYGHPGMSKHALYMGLLLAIKKPLYEGLRRQEIDSFVRGIGFLGLRIQDTAVLGDNVYVWSLCQNSE